jgi:hypothetical protein
VVIRTHHFDSYVPSRITRDSPVTARTKEPSMNKPAVTPHSEASRYTICLRGRLDSRWATRFEGMTLRVRDDGTSLLEGPVEDQAALHGLLRAVRDLGLPLIAVFPTPPSS